MAVDTVESFSCRPWTTNAWNSVERFQVTSEFLWQTAASWLVTTSPHFPALLSLADILPLAKNVNIDIFHALFREQEPRPLT